MCAAPLNGSNSPTLDFSSLLASYFNHVSSAQTSELNSLQVSSSSSALSCLSTAVQHYTSAIEILFTLFKNFSKFHSSSAAMDAKDKKEFSSATAMKQLLEEKIGRTEKLKAIVKKTEEKLKANAQPGAPTAHNDVNPQPAPSAMTVEEKEEEDIMNDLGDLPPTLIPKVNSFPAIPPPSYAEATTPSSASASSAAMFSSSTASASTSSSSSSSTSSSSSAASSPPLLPRQSSLSVLSSIPSSVLSSFSSSSWDSLFGLDSVKKQMFDTLLPPFVLPSYTLPVNCVLLHGPPLNSKSLAMHSFLSIFNPNHFFLIESSMWRSDLSSVIPMLKDTFTESKTHETKDRKNPNNSWRRNIWK